jgi:hypothetical protein
MSLVQYRDGLMIAMLACRPTRQGEFLALQLGGTMRKEGNMYELILALTSQSQSIAASFDILRHWHLSLMSTLTRCAQS